MQRGWRTRLPHQGIAWLAVASSACSGGPSVATSPRGLVAPGSMLASPAAAAPAAAPVVEPVEAAVRPAAASDSKSRASEGPLGTPGVVAAEPDATVQADPVEDALELAARLCREENHRGALHALDSALAQTAPAAATASEAARSDDGTALLTVARAGVLRDLGQRHLAVAALRSVVAAHGAAALHPGLLFELAELEWLEGNRQQAIAMTELLQTTHAGDAWLAAHAADIQGLLSELSTSPRPVRLQIRDLLGNLRGAPEASERMRALEMATAPLAKATANSPVGTTEAAQRLRASVVAIAARDESPALRARALQLAEVDAEWSVALCAAGLEDPSALVRGIAATRAIQLLGGDAVTLLVQALEREPDPGTFRRLHEALAVIVPGAPAFAPGTADDAERRAVLVAAWKRIVLANQGPLEAGKNG